MTDPRTILITGAARGIGLEMARQAVARGDRVIAAVRDPGAAGLASLPAGVRVETLDVTDPASCAALAARLEGETLDLVVCNAGVYIGRGKLGDDVFPVEAWARSFAVNVAGVFLTVEALSPRLRRPGGRIAVVSSQMGGSGRAPGGSYIYRASKAAATNLARNLAADLAPEGVSVGAYHPGWVRTDMGGGGADISVEESAAGLLARFDALGPETTGAFESYDGTALPF
ncbi:NAD(P)-dependent dehydrogenase, short-chain alcohol dehydrogenase family [Albimonas donghaensis]|uniref:NAD(P)-dependent dehydrogenase, short-chain alcohol dehydrogenase family n=1 Tax=Albimonas donghaensis TaxID=356660 RepID=A0A1H3EJE0_9RHOB|nr:SDR family oxidoreductase [Albimonas donghaensis]SDX78034.1 NAD(P)-dependent dehydrogenase, short-chain alcohol dehydrogenase family [Albimonas donghaensis]